MEWSTPILESAFITPSNLKKIMDKYAPVGDTPPVFIFEWAFITPSNLKKNLVSMEWSTPILESAFITTSNLKKKF